MPGTKRNSSGDDADTRIQKAARVSGEGGSKDGAKAKGKGKAIPRSKFRSEALPLHVSFTHTPAAVDNEEQTTPVDPGHICNLTILPTDFSTRSYGWKGTRRVTVELQGGKGKESERVDVIINVNATVVHSKEAEDEPESEVKEHTQAEAGEEKAVEG